MATVLVLTAGAVLRSLIGWLSAQGAERARAATLVSLLRLGGRACVLEDRRGVGDVLILRRVGEGE